MKKDIVIAGVGGQGILSIATTIGAAAIEMGLFLKQSEVHGMSQRGGDVMSNMRISAQEIYSDLIPFGKADIIISVEPMESLRHLPYLSKNGWLITNSIPYNNIPNYPPIETILSEIKKLPNHVLIDADNIAKELGSEKSANIVILGAASPYLDIPFEILISAINKIFKNKGQNVIDFNVKALEAGRKLALSH
ncbi:MAG: indolepyruvate oxidoreductase [Bacteroidetes bacterium CG02_land_8_20_14_3_00_31_25]|nr:MAG: indolepyruvate oxidoreductase [Bacteroidetes bacterium CG02_land_8_20_14_3_00_31_25]PIY03144.1 MAG: indolepyruvate oxidoreductase [Bacteroidetes bacterium CG_4_10_14_3_um_filter_31_20]